MARTRKPKAAVPTNVSDETIAEYSLKIRSQDLDVEEAKVIYDGAVAVRRNTIKAAKNAGVPVDALLDTHKDAKKDPQEVLNRIRDRARCAAIIQLPIGHQFGLLEGEELPETDPTLSARVKVENAKLLGLKAGRKTADREENPFEAGSEEYAAWDEAWMDGNQAHFSSKKKPALRPTEAATGSDGPEMGGAAEGEETWTCPLGMTHTGPVYGDGELADIRDVGFQAFIDGKTVDEVPDALPLPMQKHWKHGWEHAQKMGESVTGTKAA